MHWILENAVIGGLMAAAVAVACRVFQPRPALRHALWLVVLLKLVLPAPIHWPGAPLERLTGISSYAASDDWLARNAKRSEGGLHIVPTSLMVDGELPSRSSQKVAPASFDWGRALLMVWALGALVCGSRELHRRHSLQRLFASGVPPAEGTPLAQAAISCAQRIGIKTPRVRLLAGVRAPMVIGLRRPTLIWPADLAIVRNDPALRAVVSHEVAHLKRRDLWIAHLEVVIGVLLWWNPIVPLVRHKLRAAAEEACDAWAVWAWPESRRDYARALLEVSARPSTGRATPAAALAMASSTERALRGRLLGILEAPEQARLGTASCFGVLALFACALPGWSAPEFDPCGEDALQAALARSEYDVARGILEGLAQDDCCNGEWQHRLGFCLLALGRDREAIPHLERSIELDFLPSVSAYNLACGHAKLGEVEPAIDWLEQALELGFDSVEHLYEDPDLTNLHHHPRFVALREQQP